MKTMAHLSKAPRLYHDYIFLGKPVQANTFWGTIPRNVDEAIKQGRKILRSYKNAHAESKVEKLIKKVLTD